MSNPNDRRSPGDELSRLGSVFSACGLLWSVPILLGHFPRKGSIMNVGDETMKEVVEKYRRFRALWRRSDVQTDEFVVGLCRKIQQEWYAYFESCEHTRKGGENDC